ncbi:hypothetical protein PLESTM_000178400 [Pleodorina starrii]|nr:hypothetical protein PLESTM_000178400 [Pleodorina starrii]
MAETSEVSSPAGRWGGVASTSAPGARTDSQSLPKAHSGVFVDAITGRHASTSAAELLATRRLTWHKHYGWTYDAWIDDPARYALAGANGRFSLPALARGFTVTLAQAAGSAAVALQQHRHLLAPLQQLLTRGPKPAAPQPPPEQQQQQQQPQRNGSQGR